MPSTKILLVLGATNTPLVVEPSPVIVNPDKVIFENSRLFEGSPIVIPPGKPEASTLQVAPLAHSTVTFDVKITNGA